MNITHENWKLVDKDGNAVYRGYKATSHRGDEYIITGGRPPAHLGSTGRVWVEGGGEFFPTVFDFKWEMTGLTIPETVSPDMVRDYFGSDHLTITELVNVITEICNGDLSVKDLKESIIDYAMENQE